MRVRREPRHNFLHRSGVFEGHFQLERADIKDGGEDLGQIAVHEGVEFIKVLLAVGYGLSHAAVVVAQVLVGCLDKVGDFVVDVQWGVGCATLCKTHCRLGIKFRDKIKGVLDVAERVRGGAGKRGGQWVLCGGC